MIKHPVKYQPGGIKLHQNHVSIINHIIKVVLRQHQCGLWRRFPVWMCNFFDSFNDSWKVKPRLNTLKFSRMQLTWLKYIYILSEAFNFEFNFVLGLTNVIRYA